MSGVNDLVLVRGMADTRVALREWNERPGRILWPWVALSFAVACALLLAVYLVAKAIPPDPTLLRLPGVNDSATAADYGRILYRNGLVLALHAMACVAGFIAGSSLPLSAANRSGVDRWVHEKAGPLAIGFVICATLFSLTTQAFGIGILASDVAGQLGIGPGTLILGLLPHAIPELTALFLPLAAWIIASRRRRWDELLAATFVTVALAVPVLLVSAAVELWVSPELLRALAGLS
ncbi:MAG TPA: stage II sporulation protein M [Thermoleophilaceae bacterium]|nr:stage II sporulation protein M [Thermoleophilaceae bacterium]